jgi:hypothetical protein
MNTIFKIECIVVVDHDIGFFDHGIVDFGHNRVVISAFWVLGIHHIVLIFQKIATSPCGTCTYKAFFSFFSFLVFDIHHFVFLATMIVAYVVHKPHNMKRSIKHSIHFIILSVDCNTMTVLTFLLLF